MASQDPNNGGSYQPSSNRTAPVTVNQYGPSAYNSSSYHAPGAQTAPMTVNRFGPNANNGASYHLPGTPTALMTVNQYGPAGAIQHNRPSAIVNLPSQFPISSSTQTSDATSSSMLMNRFGQTRAIPRYNYVPLVEEFLTATQHLPMEESGYMIVAGIIYHLQWTRYLRTFAELTSRWTDVERGWTFLPGMPRYMVFHRPVYGTMTLPGPSLSDPVQLPYDESDDSMDG